MKKVDLSLYDTALPIYKIERCNRNRNQIGYGGEGAVFRLDEKTVYKTFDFTRDDKLINHKFQKIEALGKLRDKNFAFPTGLVGYEDEKKEGYTMKFVHVDEEISDFWMLLNSQELIKVRKLLDYVLKADMAIKRAHDMGIIIGDIRGENIMIDDEDEVVFIDTDNFSYREFTHEVVDKRMCYLEKIYGHQFSRADRDIYLYSMMALEILLSAPFIEKNQSDDFFKALVSKLNVSREVKNALRTILSDAEDKPYIGPILDEINWDEPVLNREDRQKLMFW